MVATEPVVPIRRCFLPSLLSRGGREKEEVDEGAGGGGGGCCMVVGCGLVEIPIPR